MMTPLSLARDDFLLGDRDLMGESNDCGIEAGSDGGGKCGKDEPIFRSPLSSQVQQEQEQKLNEGFCKITATNSPN